MLTTESQSLFDIETLRSEDAEYRVLERPGKCVFTVIRCAPDEPVELLAECRYTYNREKVPARAIRIAELFRDEDGR